MWACRNRQSTSISVCGSSRIFSTSRYDESVLIPGGTSVWVFVEDRVDDGCAGAGGGPGGNTDGGRSSGVEGGVRGPVAPSTMACLRKVVIWSLYASLRSEMSFRPFLPSSWSVNHQASRWQTAQSEEFHKAISLTLVLCDLACLDIYRRCGLHFRVSQDTAHHEPSPIFVAEADRQLEAGLRSDVERYFSTMTWVVDMN